MGREQPESEHVPRHDVAHDEESSRGDVHDVTTLPADKPWIIWDGG